MKSVPRLVRRAANALRRRMVVDPRHPFSFVSKTTLREIDKTLGGYHKIQLLRIPLVRQMIARDRMKRLMSRKKLRRMSEITGGVAHNTVEYMLKAR